jgi:hypothetical protein
MALVTETGAGLASAESFCSVADADTRHTNLGNASWADLSATEKEQALRRATNYMEGQYRGRWKGIKATQLQALSWPRGGAVVDGYTLEGDIVPTEVANACADLALKAAAGELNPDLDRAILREKVGPLETEYSAHSPQAKRYSAINAALAPYLMGSSTVAMLVRA